MVGKVGLVQTARSGEDGAEIVTAAIKEVA